MTAPDDWAAQQLRAMLEDLNQRKAIIERGLAEHNAEMDLLSMDPAKRDELQRRLTGPPPETPPTD